MLGIVTLIQVKQATPRNGISSRTSLIRTSAPRQSIRGSELQDGRMYLDRRVTDSVPEYQRGVIFCWTSGRSIRTRAYI
ncbi:hypothetical protein K505DRAFT_85600 [Melanomma pulvis-pyrius CBS 109.77]|uniref:Uncharacterized protein n=1 Tax=Melanomma pulvis-pyrius CBS 109.77 TaxID=1314802 RepID=A0A6A6X0N5_9PLEO|nr:hypothetical protein K505DRAFT_85600 [Melanomma pulvis-pyrius CBS 109.77]